MRGLRSLTARQRFDVLPVYNLNTSLAKGAQKNKEKQRREVVGGKTMGGGKAGQW